MDEIHSYINELISNNSKDDCCKYSKKLYRMLSQIRLRDDEVDIFREIVIPKLFILIDDKKIAKDVVYLSLLPNDDKSILQKVVDFEKTSVILEIRNPVLLFDYCLHKNQHWLLEVINDDENAQYSDVFPGDTAYLINLLKLINLTNQFTIDLNKIKLYLSKVNTLDLDSSFVEFYTKELKRVLDVVGLCQKYKGDDANISEIYYCASNSSLLEVFSKFLNLQSFDVCDNVLEKLKEYENQSEYEIFTAYIVLFRILHCLKLCKAISKNNNKDEITDIIKQTELELINMRNLKLQIEILENIFTFLFLQKKHFILNKSPQMDAQFYCSENEVRLILMFIKSVCDEIKKHNPYDKASEEFRKFTELNKHLADGLWRLELITNNYEAATKLKIQKNIVCYMLAPPESLIHLCLKQNDFNKANQVIQIFNLQYSRISSDINYTLKFIDLKEQLKKAFKIQHMKKESSAMQSYKAEPSINTLIDKFFKVDDTSENEDLTLSSSSMEKNVNFENILDLALTQCDTFEESEEMLNIALTFNTADPNDETAYSMFCKKILKIFTEINNKYTKSLRDILCDSDFDFNIDVYSEKEEFYKALCELCDEFNKEINRDRVGKFNSKHVSHKTFLKLQQLCLKFPTACNSKEQVRYLQRFLNYLKSFSKIFYVEKNNSVLISEGKDTSHFALLNFSRSEILEKLLFEKKLDLQDFEELFLKLKLDLVHHVTTIFFPKVNLGLNQHLNEHKYAKPNNLPNNNIITYIQKRNWLLAFILNEMHKIEETKLDLNEIRIKTFINFIKLPRIEKLKSLFNDNEVITALQNQITPKTINSYFEQHMFKPEVEASQHSTSSLETGTEIFEGDLKITDWKHLYDIINGVPLNQLRNSKELLDLHDMVLNELISDCFEPDYFKYVQFISDNHLRWECILNNMTTWPGQFCIEIINSELSRFDKMDKKYEEKFLKWLEKLQLYEQIRSIIQKKSWFKIFLKCKNGPREVLQCLLNTVEVDLLLKFIELHKLSEEDLQLIDENYFVALLDSNTDITKVQDLLNKLPSKHIIQICYALLKVLKKLEHLDFIASFISSSNFNSSLFKNIQTSLKILSCFSTVEQEQLWCLTAEPLSIIEILIMNTKLEKLGQVLELIKPDIENCEFDENQVSLEKIDEMLRNYAEKSLEFRVVLQPGSKLNRTPESSKLMQSLDSINFPSSKRYFLMPENVPGKTEWVQNHEATECMCCLESTFSMFNRRHHCRRCGRVICGSCSLKRMKVPTYGDIQVRVCLDCYEQSRDYAGTSSIRSEASTRSIECDYWLLTDDPSHNQIAREEFSYEYAPSVSLCFAILKHHSKNEEYPKFLLDQCDGMLRLLQPTNFDMVQEIDYLLVIKMLKSLAIAAKMLSAQCMLQWGTSLADRILSQADLLGLLAERGCLHLLPTCGQTQSCYIDASTLRRVRDKLLEGEQWNLALEVSTKAGLDNTGVFAAWGKSYLKAGSLQTAREKFQRCFDKTAHYETSTELSDSFSVHMHSTPKHSRSLTVSETRPTKNPPLLNEIVHILESNTCIIDAKILKEAGASKQVSSSTWSLSSSITLPSHTDPAICILNKLKNLNKIAAGNYCAAPSEISDSLKSVNTTKPLLEAVFYEECVYYLSRYGSHMSLLEFYVKHCDVDQCLKYMLENHLSPEVFIEIYMLCLREDLITVLQESMSTIDSTLDIWKDYLKHICRHLEKHSKLHCLYQLQQFMGDFVRASMTCIKFYQDDAATFSELTSRVDYLHKAQQHLQQELEQEQWVEVASVRKSSMDSQESFEAKGIANPSLVMKMDSKDVDKHINTIWRQIEVAKFLADCESCEIPVLEILPDILPFINEDLPAGEMNKARIPTLFGSYYERVQLAVLAIVCGTNVEDGFGIAFRIIHDYKLNPVKVYCQAGKQLAKAERYTGIAQLVSCIRSSGISDSAVTDMCDEMLILAVQTLTKVNATGPQVDGLIKLITDRAAKISAYIETKQLKSAYLLAIKHKRIGDIRRILREAEFLNQPNIKMLCQKMLHAHSHLPSHSKD